MIPKNAVISLSGGMDSSSLLIRLLTDNYSVTALAFDYGQKHKVELECAKSLCGFLCEKGYQVDFHIVELKGLSALLSSTLVEGGEEVPEGHYEEDTMKETFVPNRNKIFSSLIQASALSIAMKTNETVKIAMGIHAGDHAIYPDCRQSFRDKDYDAFLEGNWEAEKVVYCTPYLHLTKAEVLKDGIDACQQLALDYKDIYSRTNTSYKPLQINGKWYSDFKSSSSVERVEAFMTLDLEDPVAYADEVGPQNWKVVCQHVSSVIKAHSK
ncbi:7-cyano-7-deazaguanine synthase [Francisellaceae bacterium]|nr:7-cyano-7-deazaguanine synthase [Francisellaceae bacterium]